MAHKQMLAMIFKDIFHYFSKPLRISSYIAIDGNKIKLPKLGWIRFAKSREVEGRILNATIRRNPSGKYFVSILVETEVQPLEKTDSSRSEERRVGKECRT